MSRLPPVPRARAAGLVADYYARLFGHDDPATLPKPSEGLIADWWTTYAHSPPVFEQAVRHFAIYGVLSDAPPSGALSPALREVAVLRTGYLVGSRFVFSQHSKAARRNGVEEAKIEAIRDWTVSACFTPGERAVLAYTDALVLQHGRLSDGIFNALRAVLAEAEIMELSYHVTAYAGYAAIARALRLAFDDVDDRVTEVDPPASDRGKA